MEKSRIKEPETMTKRQISRMTKLKANESRERPSGNVMKPWRNQFFEVKKIGDEPPLNTEGFWPKPDHKRFDRPNGQSKR